PPIIFQPDDEREPGLPAPRKRHVATRNITPLPREVKQDAGSCRFSVIALKSQVTPCWSETDELGFGVSVEVVPTLPQRAPSNAAPAPGWPESTRAACDRWGHISHSSGSTVRGSLPPASVAATSG